MTFLSLLSSDLPHPLSPPSTYRRVQKPALSAPLHTFGRSNQAKPESCVLPSWLQDISEEGEKKKRRRKKDNQYLQGFVLENKQKHEKLCCSSCTYIVVAVSLRGSSLFCSPVIHTEECLYCSSHWHCC